MGIIITTTQNDDVVSYQQSMTDSIQTLTPCDALEESNTGRSFAKVQTNPNCINIQTLIENEMVKG